MVISPAEKASMPPDPEVAAASRRGSQTQLHNFSFPVLKKWGSQRHLRCFNVNRDGEIDGVSRRSGRTDATGPRIRAPDQEVEGGGDERGLEEVRAKLLVHLREAASRLKPSVAPKEGQSKEPPEQQQEPVPVPAAHPSSSVADEVGPWNPRKRRRRGLSSRAPIRIERHVSLLQPEARSNHTRAVRLRSRDAERPRFSIMLSREEIEEDIYAVTGCMPRRRPRKRARVLQTQLDSLFPGSWLSEITADSYKVPN